MAGQILALARCEGMKPGDRLIEQKLADALDLSRAPIRLGLKARAAARLARGEPHRGFVLAKSPTSGAAQPALAAVTRAEKVYATIAADRLAGRLPADITKAQLMRRYGLSRPELRRLLDRIAVQGWIARLAGYGWRFAETLSSPEAQAQATAFRAVIELAATAQPRAGNPVHTRLFACSTTVDGAPAPTTPAAATAPSPTSETEGERPPLDPDSL